MTPSRNCISLAPVSLSYEGRPLFENFSLSIVQGQITCLLGASGVGKSTLLKAFAGLIPGLPAQKELPAASYLGQRDALLPWARVIDNVLIGYRLRGTLDAAIEERALFLLEAVGLKKLAQAKPDELSWGMRQRVALVRTLLEDRPLVLLDEPFSALDPKNRRQLQNLLIDFLREKTVLWVTHDPAEALRVGQTLLVLEGPPLKVRRTFDLSFLPIPRAMDLPELAPTQAALWNCFQ